MNIKDIWWDSAHVNWDAVKKRYDESDPSLPMVGREHTCLFHWPYNLDKVMQKYINVLLQFQHKQLCKDYKDTKKNG